MIVHQIFGFLNDEISELFVNCSKKVKEWCLNNNYDYMLWDKNMCDNLINSYPKYKELYNNVKYPIMQVDIIRFIILHKYGGLYIDMDCIPNIEKLDNDNFRISYKIGKKRKHYEMEVIQSYKNNNLLLEFLDYVQTQIEEKDKIDIYKTWKGRYIYQTTGPQSLNRFLKSKQIKKFIINEALTKNNLLNLNGNEDFISYPSCSYMNTLV
tara:strand:+ start:393 stop:1022 length:630 start_codon:yes stop_codon:yes gene_type:complete